MDPTSVLSIDPPDHLSDEQKELYSACSPRMKVALAIAGDFKDEDNYWKVLKGFKYMGCTDLVSLGSRNMGVTPTKIFTHFGEMDWDGDRVYDMEYDMSLGKASRIKEIANSAMKAQDKNTFHKFLYTHGVKTLRGYKIDDEDVGEFPFGDWDELNETWKIPPSLPLSCPEWHTKKREKSLKRKREEAKDEKEESNGDE